MSATPHVARIDIYPIKSLDPVTVERVTVLESGALAGDRRYALRDSEGRFVNAKREARIHQVRAAFSADLGQVTLRTPEMAEETFSIEGDRSGLEEYLSQFFGYEVVLDEDGAQGFPDDVRSPGPTVISTNTLEAVAGWYEGLTVADVRARFRSNIEIGGVPAFWEDRLYGKEGEPVSFAIGDVQFLGINPCLRCVVPTRDQQNGDRFPQFTKTFAQQRQKTLPTWAEASRFDSFYRLAVNTQVSPNKTEQSFMIGDLVA